MALYVCFLLSCSQDSSLGLPLGLEAPVMTPHGVNFLFFPLLVTEQLCIVLHMFCIA